MGWSVFPLWPKSKRPHGYLCPQGHNEASSFAPDALYWWSRVPDSNIGLSCRQSGLLVIDVDPRNGGDDTFWELERKLGGLPLTLAQETPGGGYHYFFRHPEGVRFKKELGPGVDLKSDGFVLLPPSRTQQGQYRWLV